MELFKLFGRILIQNSEANDAIDETSDRAEKSESRISSAFKKVGAAIVTFFAVDKLKEFGLSCINAAANAQAMAAQFTSVFAELESDASSSLSAIAAATGVSENRMKGSFTKIAAYAKTTGMHTDEALTLTDRAMRAVADSAAFYDRSLEDVTESLQSFLKGNYENDAALGLSATETTRNAAANKLYGKSFKDLSEAQKQLTLLQMVEDANDLSGAFGQAARESATWTNQTGNLKQSWIDFLAVVGTNVLPLAVTVVTKMSKAVDGLSAKVPIAVAWFKNLKDKATALADYAIAAFQPALDNVKFAFDAIRNAVQPLIDKFTEYMASGELVEGATTTLKEAIDLLAAAFETCTSWLAGIIQGFQDAVTWGKEHETETLLIATALGTLTAAVVAYNVVQAIKNAGGIVELAQLAALAIGIAGLTAAEVAHTAVTTIATAATSAFTAVIAFLTSPITLVIAAIGALIAIGVALYKNWDEISAKAKQIWNAIRNFINTTAENIRMTVVSKFEEARQSLANTLEAIRQKFFDIFEKAKSIVKNAIETIKGFFKFEWSLPRIKLPHFSISGKFSLNPPSAPHFSVDWYKKAMDDGMILNQPTIFGFNNKTGQFMGAGEAGSETVVGTESLMTMITTAVSNQSAGLLEVLTKILKIVAAFDSSFDTRIITALETLQLKIDDREFGRLVRSV